MFAPILVAYFLVKKYERASHIISLCVCAFVFVFYFEVTIHNYNVENGIVFITTWGVLEFMFLSVLKYFWVMVAYDFAFTTYGFVRLYMLRQKLCMSLFDLLYNFGCKLIAGNIALFIFIKLINVLQEAKKKLLAILDHWKRMMDISPIGIIIYTSKGLEYINQCAKRQL